ncbi:MAG TPA: EDR1-related protein, partial [Stenomitos sp.]
HDAHAGRFFSVFGRLEVPAIAQAPEAAPKEAAPRPATPKHAFELPRGVEVSVLRSSGEMDGGWILKGRTGSAQALLAKTTELGALTKLVGIEELLRQNLYLIVEGLMIKVPRSSGALDEGWITRGLMNGRIMVEKPGVGRKQLTPDQFFPFNRDLWGGEREATESTVTPKPVTIAPGTPIRLMKANGDWQEGWSVVSQADDGTLTIERETEQGLLKMKRPLGEILEQNPLLFPLGMPVRVPRTTGSLEDGWFIQEAQPTHVVVDKPGVGTKDVSSEELFQHNRDRLLGEGEGPTVAPSQEAIAQRWAFARDNRLEGWLWDGFADGGRGLNLDSLGWPINPQREILVLDRLSDAALRKHLTYARELQNQAPFARASELVRYVYEQLGGPVLRIESRVATACAALKGQRVLIGDVPRILGGGVARHRALLFQVLAEEAGLRPVLVRGFAGITCPSAHAWNELLLGEGQQALVDLSRKPEHAFASLADAGTRRFYHSGGAGVQKPAGEQA